MSNRHGLVVRIGTMARRHDNDVDKAGESRAETAV
jgi:hypothetical protein